MNDANGSWRGTGFLRAFALGAGTMGVLAALLAGAFLLGKQRGSTTQNLVAGPAAAVPAATPASSCPNDAFDRAVKGTVRLEARATTGTGFLLSDTMIVTNRHVIEGGGPVTVQFADGGKGTGTVAGASDTLDVAIVRLSTPALALPLTWGNSDALKSLDTVVAVGYPLGFTGPPSLAKGNVSRVLTSNTGVPLIQTDAAVNEGNSGGPLLNECGAVVGLITLKALGAEGIGLAQAASKVRPEVERLGGASTAAPSSRTPALPFTATPQRPPGTPGTASPSTAVYLGQARLAFDSSDFILGYLQARAREPSPRDPLWQANVAQGLQNLKANNTALRNLSPPPCLTAYHDLLLQSAREGDAGADAFFGAIAAVDTAAMARVATRFETARTLLNQARASLAASPPNC